MAWNKHPHSKERIERTPGDIRPKQSQSQAEETQKPVTLCGGAGSKAWQKGAHGSGLAATQNAKLGGHGRLC